MVGPGGPGRRRAAHRARTAGRRGRRPGRLDRGQRLLPHRRRARRRRVHRRRHARDPAQDQPRRPRARAAGSTSSVRSRPTTRLGGHLVQGHVDGDRHGRGPRRPASTGRSSRSRLPADLAPYLVDEGLGHRRRRLAHRRRRRRRRAARSPSRSSRRRSPAPRSAPSSSATRSTSRST